MKLTWEGDFEDLYECYAPHGATVTSILIDEEYEIISPGMALDAEDLGPLSSARWTEEWFDHICRSKGLPSAIAKMAQKTGMDDDYADKETRKRHWISHWKKFISPEENGDSPFVIRLTDTDCECAECNRALMVRQQVRFRVEWEGEVPLVMPCPNPLDPA